jgi:hypothetical protein
VRAVFFLLLFANLAYLAWAEWIDVPQPPAANDVYAKLPRLKLVGENSGSPKQPSSGRARKTVMQQSPQPAAECLSVGPFYDEAAAARGASLLRDKGLSPRQRSAQGEVPKGFWVYIGGLKTDRDVSQVLRVLQQSHVDDAHLMPDTDDEHRVSVGLFSDRDRADRRAQSLHKLGLQPEVADRKVPAPVFWIDVSLAPGTPRPTPQDFLAASDHPATGVPASQPTVTPCPAGTSPPEPGPLPTAPGTTTTFRTKVAGASQVP